MSASRADKPSERHRKDWNCPNCEFKVFGSKNECPDCGKWRPRERRTGDWNCPKCKELVFASKNRCFKCSTPKPASEERSSSSSVQGYEKREGDWECKACGYKDNFARRPTCFKCDKSKDWEPSDEDLGMCTVCLDAKVGVVVLSCGHACMCQDCSTKVDGTCPMCRKQFDQSDVARMYLS